MSTRNAIPDEVLRHQYDASDPVVSAWVSANAGSGKTHVLAQRVIRLMLSGTDPAKILCLTFTKAAAANMGGAVFDKLAKWTSLSDHALNDAILETCGAAPDAAQRVLARRLFAIALETPGGLKVQTIHAFCTRLLQQFPFEANVAARFTVIEDAARIQLLNQLSLDVLLEAARDAQSMLGRALATAITNASDQVFRESVNEAIEERDSLIGWIAQAGGVEAAVGDLTEALGIAPGETIETIESEVFSGSLIAQSEWAAVAATLREGSKNDGEQADRFARLEWLAGDERLKAYWSIFCTDKLAPRASIVTKATREKDPALFQRLIAEQDRVCALIARRREVVTRDRTAALITVAAAVVERYQKEKDRRGLLDYDDLIDKTLAMLATVQPSWVHYKLDLGIDHVLIDEAQDTSPKQWEVIERLVSEFASGAGARASLQRSIFVVGDDKQSIFSFQGAAPEAFAQKRSEFKRAYEAAGLSFRPLEFKYSFRSAQIVLDAVDKVFRQPAAFHGLTAEAIPTAHTAVRAHALGLVEIWPEVEPDEKSQVEGWDAPFDSASEISPRVKLARRIAKCVRIWIDRGDRVGDGDERHALTPRDVLILVRQRGPLFEAIIRALKNAGVDVAGADRLVLADHIAVMDLLALADALLLPDDDLALATVLKSPLFGLGEDQLFELAWRRRGSLRARLRAKARENTAIADAAERLDRLAKLAKSEPPFAFYARVLGPESGRKQILARLSLEAADALDEFLNLALDYERHETPSLQGFVSWLRTANAEVKRDMEVTRDEVRVMTVHGAKGLEAPIMVLADTAAPPAGPYPPRLLRLPDSRDGNACRFVWAGRKDDDVGIVAKARNAAVEAAQNEYRRLLYVAMTRAADRLIICGAAGARGKPEGCWYDLVHNALAAEATKEPADDGAGYVWRYRKVAPDGDDAIPAEKASARDRTLPDWLGPDAPTEPSAPVPLSPASAYDEATLVRTGGAGADRAKALARGSIMHRLLQSLPDVPRETRAEAARRHLARGRAGEPVFDADEREAIVDQVLKILDDPRFRELFEPGSRAEVPIVGRLAIGGRSVAVSGQVDRLAVSDGRVLIADYKTNRPAPRRFEDVPPAYVTQLALYRAVLGRLYPDKVICTVLLWTDVPDLMEVSAEAMDQALAQLTLP